MINSIVYSPSVFNGKTNQSKSVFVQPDPKDDESAFLIPAVAALLVNKKVKKTAKENERKELKRQQDQEENSRKNHEETIEMYDKMVENRDGINALVSNDSSSENNKLQTKYIYLIIGAGLFVFLMFVFSGKGMKK